MVNVTTLKYGKQFSYKGKRYFTLAVGKRVVKTHRVLAKSFEYPNGQLAPGTITFKVKDLEGR